MFSFFFCFLSSRYSIGERVIIIRTQSHLAYTQFTFRDFIIFQVYILPFSLLIRSLERLFIKDDFKLFKKYISIIASHVLLVYQQTIFLLQCFWSSRTDHIFYLVFTKQNRNFGSNSTEWKKKQAYCMQYNLVFLIETNLVTVRSENEKLSTVIIFFQSLKLVLFVLVWVFEQLCDSHEIHFVFKL
jgi:hypothetical protein